MGDNTDVAYIYGLVSTITNQLRYVGKSVNPEKRCPRHITERHVGETHKNRWIRKVLDDGGDIETIILDVIPLSDWVFWEQWYINYYNYIGCKLTNGTEGGDQPPSTKGRKHTEDAKRKMSEAKKGKPIPWLNNGKERSESHKNNLSKAMKGRVSINKGKKFSKEYRKKLSEAHIGIQAGEKHPMYGKKHTKESLEKMSKSLTGKIYPSTRKIVLQYTLEDEFIKEYPSISIAKKETGAPNIGNCCSGNAATSGGYKWKFKNKI